MHRVSLDRPDDLDGFRAAARRLVSAGIPPEQVLWLGDEQEELFAADPPGDAAAVTVPAAFIRLAADVVCHRDPERFALLYQALWRLAEGERALLEIASDSLVHRLERMAKAVRRDLHKMHAFLRFRGVRGDDGERFIAWFEPEHHILRRAAPFFVGRFASMRWSILTPGGSVHWDGREVAFGKPVPPERVPQGDELDDWWRTYYRAMFNPARANPQAMRAEMPKKYWRNLPEAALIPQLLADAGGRAEAMLKAEPKPPRKRIRRIETHAATVPPGAIAQLAADAAACERCPLHDHVTQTVFGEGPTDAPVVLLGEQPGHEEDLAGRPFVGPAGRVLDRALAAAGIDRARVYLTNAVKHFKFVPRGKRRIHQTPGSYEIQHCRWWLQQELALIRPQLVVALGSTAAHALVGRPVSVLRERGRIVRLGNSAAALITVHPSYLLRLPEGAAQSREFHRLVADLAQVVRLVPRVQTMAAREPHPIEERRRIRHGDLTIPAGFD